MARCYRSGFLAVMAILIAWIGAAPAFADNDRVSFANDITVAEGSTATDVVCIFCAVRVHGQVRGDVVSILGGVILDGEREVAGDVVSVGGDVSLGDQSSIAGDLAVVAGDLNMAPGASVHGERTVIAGRGWLLLPLAPVLVIVGVLWLALYLVRRNRYVFPVYPQGRGF